MSEDSRDKTMCIMPWIARISAGIMAAIILIIFIGHGLFDGLEPLLSLTPREGLMMLAFILIWLRLFLGWKWEWITVRRSSCGISV